MVQNSDRLFDGPALRVNSPSFVTELKQHMVGGRCRYFGMQI